MTETLADVAPKAGSGSAFSDFLPIILILIVGGIVFLFVRKFFFD